MKTSEEISQELFRQTDKGYNKFAKKKWYLEEYKALEEKIKNYEEYIKNLEQLRDEYFEADLK